MNCDQFQQRVHFLLDERKELAEDAALNEHAVRCPACNTQLQLWPKINASLLAGQMNQSSLPIAPVPTQHTVSAETGKINPVTPQRHGVTPAGFAKVSLGGLAITASLLFLAVSNQFGDSIPSIETSNLGDPIVNTQTIDDVASQPALATSDTGSYAASLAASDPTSRSNSDSPAWWSMVQEERWVLSTIPAMNSVSQSVAPLGRSMKQALTILMSQPTRRELSPSPTGSSGLDSSLKQPGSSSSFEEQTWNQNSLYSNERLA